MFKRLVAYAKCNRLSYNSGLMFHALIFVFRFALLRDYQNVSLRVFDECQILHIWTP
jgi:hypothetical protein